MTNNENIMTTYRELMLGCGHSRERRVLHPGVGYGLPWANLTTLDLSSECNPDVVFDLETLGERDLPFCANEFNEIHAYEVLEHCGTQGDYRMFFAQFRAFWRILKSGGYLCATVPDWKSVWAWGDPGHTRIINMGTLVFLSKRQYENQIGKTAMSDYRSLMDDMDFEIVRAKTIGEQFEFVLQAIK